MPDAWSLGLTAVLILPGSAVHSKVLRSPCECPLPCGPDRRGGSIASSRTDISGGRFSLVSEDICDDDPGSFLGKEPRLRLAHPMRRAGDEDERADEAQRDAIDTLVSGDAGGPWGVLAWTWPTVHGPKPVAYDVQLDGVNSRVKAGNSFEVVFETIKNPVSGAEVHPGATLPEGIVFKQGDSVRRRRSACRTKSPTSIPGKYTAVAPFEYSGASPGRYPRACTGDNAGAHEHSGETSPRGRSGFGSRARARPASSCGSASCPRR